MLRELAPATKLARILIIDDDRDVTNLFSEWLSCEGHKTRAVNDGVGAIYHALDFRPDLVLLDVRMPVISGWMELRLFQDDPRLRDVPVILISADAAALDANVPLSYPIMGHLLKPFSRLALIDTVQSALI